jgi:hypothetical protein
MIVEASSVAANARHRILERAAREHRRAKTDRLDSEATQARLPVAEQKRRQIESKIEAGEFRKREHAPVTSAALAYNRALDGGAFQRPPLSAWVRF